MFYLVADEDLGKVQAIIGDDVTSFLRFQERFFWVIYTLFGVSGGVSFVTDITKGQCKVCKWYCLSWGKGDAY